jgi:hypothetical protein
MNSRHGSYIWTSVFIGAYYLLTVLSNSSAYSKETLASAGVEPARAVTRPATPFDIYLSLEKRVSDYTWSLPQQTSRESRHFHF